MDSNPQGKGSSETTTNALGPGATISQRLKNVAASAQPALDRLSARVGRRLKAVPQDRIVRPSATIEAPVALQYALLGEDDEVADLREMFENLLVASIDSQTAAGAHPAFVSMISQMTPDEARILTSIDRNDYAILNFHEHGTDLVVGSRTRLGIGIGINEARQQQYLSNLDRLGILRISNANPSNVDEANALFAAHQTEFPGRNIYTTCGSIIVTPLGRQFLDTCVSARDR